DIESGSDGSVYAEVAHVADDANDFTLVFFVAAPGAEMNFLADGVAGGKEHAGGGFGNEQDAVCAEAVSGRENAALTQGNGHGAEIIRCGSADFGGGLVFFGDAAALDGEA